MNRHVRYMLTDTTKGRRNIYRDEGIGPRQFLSRYINLIQNRVGRLCPRYSLSPPTSLTFRRPCFTVALILTYFTVVQSCARFENKVSTILKIHDYFEKINSFNILNLLICTVKFKN